MGLGILGFLSSERDVSSSLAMAEAMARFNSRSGCPVSLLAFFGSFGQVVGGRFSFAMLGSTVFWAVMV